MANLDSLLNRTYSVDGQYLAVNVLSGTYEPQNVPSNPLGVVETSLSAQVLDGPGAGGTGNLGEKIKIIGVNDSINTVTFEFITSSTVVGTYTDYVLGYDAPTNSILVSLSSPSVIGLQLSQNSLPAISGSAGIITPNTISPQTTITYQALAS